MGHHRKSPELVVFTVENTGEALAPELVSMLVDPFQRGTERIHNDYAGVGLGLAIVKSITRAHDGRLTLTPGPAGGLSVVVQLPAAPPTAAVDDQGKFRTALRGMVEVRTSRVTPRYERGDRGGLRRYLGPQHGLDEA